MEELRHPAKFLIEINAMDYTNAGELKIVVVGDKEVGRSRLMATIYKGDVLTPSEWHILYPKLEYEGSVHRSYIKQFDYEKETLTLSFWDTPSIERVRFRPLTYTQVDLIIILFDLQRKSTLHYPEIYVPDPENISSFKNKNEKEVERNLLQEIAYHCPGVPFLLVGNKSDASEHTRQVSKQEGKATAARISARQYLEISTVTGEGIIELLNVGSKLGLIHKSENPYIPPPVPPSPTQSNLPDPAAATNPPSCCSLF
jgi:small GTP-binding protein